MPIQQLKLQLLQQKLHLERQLFAIHADFQRGRSANSNEQAIERKNEQVLNTLEHNASQQLKQITAALERMEQGKYYLCQRCNHEISAARLEAHPSTTLCIHCANKLN